MKNIGVGVIGLGMGSSMLGINTQEDSHLEVRALCDANFDRLKAVAERHKIEYVTEDYQELVRRDDIQIVGVYSPDHLHGEHAIAALKAGKHVICTKPMVTTIEHCEAIVELTDKTGLKFLVGQTCRFVPHFMAAHELYESGELGELLFAETHYVHDMRLVFNNTPWRYQAPQDFMFGGGCHPIDLIRWFMGDVEEVFVYAQTSGMDKRYPADKHDNFLINLKFKNGKIGRILAVYGLVEPPMPSLGLSVFGTLGSVANERVIFDRSTGKEPQNLRASSESGHLSEVVRYMKHFEDCIENDKKPLIDARDGAKVIATGVAAWESIQTGLPVKVRNEF